MDVAEKLAWMDEAYLGKYEAIGLDSEIKLQKPFEKPIEVTHKYSISSTESEENNTYLSYNTVIETALDEKLYLAFDILDYALVSAPGAPLKQALIDAGIGSEITGGYDSGTLQPTFSVIAKNTNPQEKEHFLAVIRETLEAAIAAGDKEAAQANLLVAISEINKAASKGVYHKNNAARKVSRLSKAVNGMA